ncbi:MAG: hypothetical protein ACL93V_02715 [Candidatus Electrothrix sp. YB6]
MKYSTHTIRFGIILFILSFFFFVGNYIFFSKYECLLAENEKYSGRTEELIEKFNNTIEEIEKHKLKDNILTRFGISVIGHFSNSVRDIVREENNMIDQRMMWMLTLNGLLFTTLGFAWGGNRVLNWLPWILSGLGALSTFSFGLILQCGLNALEHMNELWFELQDYSEYPLPPMTGLSRESIICSHLLPWNCLPQLLYSVWLIVAFAIAFEQWERAGNTSNCACS